MLFPSDSYDELIATKKVRRIDLVPPKWSIKNENQQDGFQTIQDIDQIRKPN